jgi:DNA-directed RNA polymerase subunit RPC12/RpoP
MTTKDLVFECKKCGHLLFITGTASEKVKKISKLNNYECPNCSAEREENWVYVRTGDYQKEYGVE